METVFSALTYRKSSHGWIVWSQTTVELKRSLCFVSAPVHICHCCSHYQVSVLCNILEILCGWKKKKNQTTNVCSQVKMQRVATCLMFWQLAGVRHLSPAPTAGVLCQPPNSPPPPPSGLDPSWKTVAYITQLLQSSAHTTHVYVWLPVFFLEFRAPRETVTEKGEAPLHKHAQSPAFLGFLASYHHDTP